MMSNNFNKAHHDDSKFLENPTVGLYRLIKNTYFNNWKLPQLRSRYFQTAF